MERASLRPHVASLGYAIFLVINATQVWGGVFPFLPTDFQTAQVTLGFYLSQSLAFFVAFVASTVGSYYYPSAARRMLVTLGCSLVFLGSVCIIAALYLPAFVMPLVMVGGAFLGVGTAAVYMLWQRYFSSISSEECNYRLIMGTALAAVFYSLLFLIPIALTAFLVPVVFLPLCALCLTLAVRQMSFDQPMFEDRPLDHPEVYRHLLSTTWRSALCVGALGFASGLARGVAVLNEGLVDSLNTISVMGMFVAAVLLLLMWLFFSTRFSLATVFRVLYPIVVTMLLLYPFTGERGTGLFTSVTYMAFTFAVLVMMMQCAQISRERGTNPVFTYGFFGCAVYGCQSVGFLLGWTTEGLSVMGIGQTAVLSLVAAWVLGMVLLITSVPARGLRTVTLYDPESIVFAGRARRKQRPLVCPALVRVEADLRELDAATCGRESAATEAANGMELDGDALSARAGEPLAGEEDRVSGARDAADYIILDKLSKKCLVIREAYGLSTRETEVMELIARGLTVADISERLFISMNTVRTHSKHIYTKLDVHSKQELSALIHQADC